MKEVKRTYLKCVVVDNVGYCYIYIYIYIVTIYLKVYKTLKFDYAMMLRLESDIFLVFIL